ncbi:insulinase family protein [Pseudomonas xanthosomatis]|uniref:M16 family metallopeptidase n=1 Tax=Pseudomonas xanthosomatis TaxID=2842356 RepID=UPI001C3D3763|nr:pitrilysin family protein [Pseudomonas xanthosomatis]QXH47003.1 insulinase family protein [Pseudomonas xanthosomatis]
MSLPPASLHHFTLANGLQVYLREDHRAPLVSAQLWYHVGASHERDGQTGLSHMLEHLMFEGSSKLAPGEYSALMTRIGAAPNAFTVDDATVYPLTLPANRLEIGLEAMADAMASATLETAPFERELKVVMAERRSQVDNYPLALALERHNSLAHGPSPYANPVIGHLADLQRLTPAAARSWYQDWYHPNNATLAVAGAVSLERLKTLVSRHFTAILAQPLPATEPPRAGAGLSRRSLVIRQRGLREGLLMSFNVPSAATAANPQMALALIPDLLAKGSSARLKQQLLHKENLLQALSCGYDPLKRGDSLINIYAFTNAGATTPDAVAQRILDALGALGQNPPEAHELARAKARLLARQVFAQDDIAGQAHAIGQRAASGLDPTLIGAERQAVQAVTAEQVRQAAAQYLHEARMTTTLMHGQENADD